MNEVRPRLEVILRRWKMDYRYSSIVSPTWTPFEDSEYGGEQRESICSKRPGNRKFDILTKKGDISGAVTIHTCQQNKFYRGSTPWGELEIRKSGLTSYEVLRGPITMGTIRERISGMKAIVSFQSDQELHLKGWRLWHSRMKAQTDTGSLSVVCEHGQRPNPGANRHMTLSRRDYKSLSDRQKKEVVETDKYAQWRISLSGPLPTRDEDILGILVMGICRSCLYAEHVAATSGYSV